MAEAYQNALGTAWESFSFTYQKDWIASYEQFLLDFDIAWFGGAQYLNQRVKLTD